MPITGLLDLTSGLTACAACGGAEALVCSVGVAVAGEGVWQAAKAERHSPSAAPVRRRERNEPENKGCLMEEQFLKWMTLPFLCRTR